MFMAKKISKAANPARFSFQIQNRALAPFTHLKLFNGYNEVVGKCYGDMDMEIPQGLYQLRIEMNDFVEDRNYRVEAGSQVNDEIIDFKLNSAIPVYGFSSTHEYFSNPAEEWSRKSSVTGLGISGSSLFLFLSYSEEDKPFDMSFIEAGYFSLLDGNRKLKYRLRVDRVKLETGKNENAGVFFASVCFTDEMSAGQYYLIYRSPDLKREIPVYVYQDWQTQVFIRIREFPIFASTRISLSRNGFMRNDEDILQLDAMISKLHNGMYVLPADLMVNDVNGKWENPMLGIMACYMFLLSDITDGNYLYLKMLTSLEASIVNIHESPDMAALRLMGAVLFNNAIPEEPLSAPCMLAVGLNAFLKQSMAHPHLIEADGLVEKIFPRLVKESVYTMYEPLPQTFFVVNQKVENTVKNITKGIKFIDKLAKGVSWLILKNRMPTITGAAPMSVPSAAPQAEEVTDDWVSSSIISQLSHISTDPDQLDIAAIAQQLQVTTNTVKKTLGVLQEKGAIKELGSAVLEHVDKKELRQAVADISAKIDTLLKDE